MLGVPVKDKLRQFVRKYFLAGQSLEEGQVTALATLTQDVGLVDRIMVTQRKLIGILLPVLFFEICWWCQAVKHDYFSLFPDRYILSITMVGGSLVAGMTSEGGGAVAFPVMTFALGIQPTVARDFSLMIQSCGMTAAAFTIFWMKVKLEWNSLLFCSLGAIGGMIFGLEVVDKALTPPEKKLSFVCIWFSFCFALFLLNRQHKRRTFDTIPSFGVWQAGVLTGVGAVGGIFSSVAGSGVDICSFSVLSLLFRVSEKVSTPTSIVLMAVNTCVGFYWRQMMTETGVSEDAWNYLKVCVPIVVIFAPLGSIISSHFHRQVLAFLIYILDTVALVSAFIVIPMTTHRIILSVTLLVVGFLVFLLLSLAGHRLLQFIEKRELEEVDTQPGLTLQVQKGKTEEQ